MTVQVGNDYAVAKQTTWVFETGYDIHPTSIRPAKDELSAFLEFLTTHHSSVEVK